MLPSDDVRNRNYGLLLFSVLRYAMAIALNVGVFLVQKICNVNVCFSFVGSEFSGAFDCGY